MSGQINVEVDSGPAVDLNAVISEVREQYENTAKKNQKELEAWFQKKVRVERPAVCNDCMNCFTLSSTTVLLCLCSRKN